MWDMHFRVGYTKHKHRGQRNWKRSVGSCEPERAMERADTGELRKQTSEVASRLAAHVPLACRSPAHAEYDEQD